MVNIRNAKQNNFTQFTRLIESMEDRFRNVASDDVVDINSLQVIRTRSGRISKQRTNLTPKTPKSVPTRKGRGRPPRPSLSFSASSVPSSPSQMSQDSSGFESASCDTPPSSIQSGLCVRSILYDRAAQQEASKNLLCILKRGGVESRQTAANLYERFKVILGRDDLPNSATSRPFFTFREDLDIGVTLLCDTPDLTPWTLICLKFFGKETLAVYQQIYKFVLAEAAAKAAARNGRSISSTPTSRPAINVSEYLPVVAVRRSARSKQMDCTTDEFHHDTQINPSRTTTTPTPTPTSTSTSTCTPTHTLTPSSSTKSPSSLSSSYTSITARPIYTSSSFDSMVYDNVKQLASLRNLAAILRVNSVESRQMRRGLTQKVFGALGHNRLPFGKNVHPFFTFHEEGEIGASFLFDTETMSPWNTICSLYFGEEILSVCREIYQMIHCPPHEHLDKLDRLATGRFQSPQAMDCNHSQSWSPN